MKLIIITVIILVILAGIGYAVYSFWPQIETYLPEDCSLIDTYSQCVRNPKCQPILSYGTGPEVFSYCANR